MRAAAFALLLAAALPAAATSVCEPAALHLVRHAEKAAGADPDVELSDAGRTTAQALATYFATRPLDAVYATHLRRTQQTAMPAATARGLELRVLPAADTDRLVAALKQTCGQHVLVVGHSNTVPAIAAAFGHEPFEIGESDFGTVWTYSAAAWAAERFVP